MASRPLRRTLSGSYHPRRTDSGAPSSRPKAFRRAITPPIAFQRTIVLAEDIPARLQPQRSSVAEPPSPPNAFRRAITTPNAFRRAILPVKGRPARRHPHRSSFAEPPSPPSALGRATLPAEQIPASHHPTNTFRRAILPTSGLPVRNPPRQTLSGELSSPPNRFWRAMIRIIRLPAGHPPISCLPASHPPGQTPPGELSSPPNAFRRAILAPPSAFRRAILPAERLSPSHPPHRVLSAEPSSPSNASRRAISPAIRLPASDHPRRRQPSTRGAVAAAGAGGGCAGVHLHRGGARGSRSAFRRDVALSGLAHVVGRAWDRRGPRAVERPGSGLVRRRLCTSGWRGAARGD